MHPDQRHGDKTYSHCAEDIMVANFFDLIGQPRPSYLDLGAHHPVNMSNTALLYEKGSRGVNIEANPNLITDFYKWRAQDKNINVGVGPNRGTMPFYMFDELSGRNTFDPEMAKPFFHEGRWFESKPIDINVITLQDIIEQYCDGKFPDFLSIDIEGMDESVLRSVDLSNGPKIMCVEAHYHNDNSSLKQYLSDSGYICYCRLSVDLIFVRQDFKKFIY